MNKVLGIVFFILAGLVLALGIANMAPQFSAAQTVADHQSDYKLETNTTDLRIRPGVEFTIQIFVAAALGMLGFYLYNSETEQTGYAIVVGVLVLGTILIRVTPILPWSVVKLSPGTAFYGTVGKLPLTGDATSWYTVLPMDKNFRIGVADANAVGEGKGVAAFLFPDEIMAHSYDATAGKTVILGSISGTATIARGSHLAFLIPKIKVNEIVKE